MKHYKSLATVCDAAIKASKNEPKEIFGVFQSINTSEYYFSCDTNEIRVCDEFIGQYQDGELLNNHPVS